jgi:hypothetical protein
LAKTEGHLLAGGLLYFHAQISRNGPIDCQQEPSSGNEYGMANTEYGTQKCLPAIHSDFRIPHSVFRIHPTHESRLHGVIR